MVNKAYHGIFAKPVNNTDIAEYCYETQRCHYEAEDKFKLHGLHP